MENNFEEIIKQITIYIASGVEAFATLIIALSSLQAIFRSLRSFFFRKDETSDTETIRLTLGRWLAIALEFELAADILLTAVAPTWDDIGKLAAIIMLRTALNFFLQKEVEQSKHKETANK